MVYLPSPDRIQILIRVHGKCVVAFSKLVPYTTIIGYRGGVRKQAFPSSRAFGVYIQTFVCTCHGVQAKVCVPARRSRRDSLSFSLSLSLWWGAGTLPLPCWRTVMEKFNVFSKAKADAVCNACKPHHHTEVRPSWITLRPSRPCGSRFAPDSCLN